MIRSHLKIIVLKTLEKKPMSGYDLVKEIHSSTGHWKPSYGSIYPLLKELHSDILVNASESGRRKIYSITPKGKRMVHEILRNKKKLFDIAVENLRGFEILADKKEIAFINNLHTSLRNNFLPFREVTHEMQEFTQLMMELNAQGKIGKNERVIREILNDATARLRRIERSGG